MRLPEDFIGLLLREDKKGMSWKYRTDRHRRKSLRGEVFNRFGNANHLAGALDSLMHLGIRPAGRCFDVGCGLGFGMLHAARVGYAEISGCELPMPYYRPFVDYFDGKSGFSYQPVDFFSQDFGGGYSLVVCQDVLEHISDPSLAIRKMISMLDSEGVLLILQGNHQSASFVLSEPHYGVAFLSLLDRMLGAQLCRDLNLIPSEEDYVVNRWPTIEEIAEAAAPFNVQVLRQFTPIGRSLSTSSEHRAMIRSKLESALPNLRQRICTEQIQRAVDLVADRYMKVLDQRPGVAWPPNSESVSRVDIPGWVLVISKRRFDSATLIDSHLID